MPRIPSCSKLAAAIFLVSAASAAAARAASTPDPLTLLDSMRRHSHSRTVSLDAPAPVEDAGWSDLLPEDEPSASDELVLKESLDLLQKALTRLPTMYRSAIALCDIEGLSYEDISKVMDVPVGTVRSRIHQGRVLLRKAYEELERSGGIRS